MSGVAALWQRAGAPLPPNALAPALAALAPAGPDGEASWQTDTVALGNRHLQLVPGAGPQLAHLPEAGLSLTADVRLDNRAELAAALGLPPAERDAHSDADLVVRAYARWGRGCAAHLLGRFALIVWDARQGWLWCALDPLGEAQLHVYTEPGRVLCASTPAALMALPGVPRAPNLATLARMDRPLSDFQPMTATFYAGIERLSASCHLTFTPGATPGQASVYWEPDPTRRLPAQSDADVLAGLRELLFEAVRTRLRTDTPIGALLSGGLDSSSVTALAARVLAQANRSLFTLSAVVPEAARAAYTDERPYIEAFRTWPNIEPVYITAEDTGPFDGLEAAVGGPLGPLVTSRHYLYTAFAQAARSRGARLVLDGVGGEYGATVGGLGLLAQWARTGHWRTAWREALALARAEGRPAWRVVLGQVVRPAVFGAMRPGAASFERMAGLSVLRPEFVRARLPEAEGEWRAQYQRRSALAPTLRENQAQAIRRSRGHIEVSSYLATWALRFPAPLADRRVLEHCLAAPDRLKLHNGYPRSLIRLSLEGILPPAIQWRTSKEPFSPDYPARYARQIAAVRAQLAAIPQHAPVRAVVDVAKLQRLAAQPVPAGDNRGVTEAAFAALHVVPRGVALLAFLQQFPDFAEPV